jgi:hypothetical protein
MDNINNKPALLPNPSNNDKENKPNSLYKYVNESQIKNSNCVFKNSTNTNNKINLNQVFNPNQNEKKTIIKREIIEDKKMPFKKRKIESSIEESSAILKTTSIIFFGSIFIYHLLLMIFKKQYN